MAEIQQSVSAEPTDIIEFVSSNVLQMPRGSGWTKGFIELILCEKLLYFGEVLHVHEKDLLYIKVVSMPISILHAFDSK